MIPEVFCRDFVEGFKLTEVGKIDVLLDDAVQTGAGFLEDDFKIIENAT